MKRKSVEENVGSKTGKNRSTLLRCMMYCFYRNTRIASVNENTEKRLQAACRKRI